MLMHCRAAFLQGHLRILLHSFLIVLWAGSYIFADFWRSILTFGLLVTSLIQALIVQLLSLAGLANSRKSHGGSKHPSFHSYSVDVKLLQNIGCSHFGSLLLWASLSLWDVWAAWMSVPRGPLSHNLSIITAFNNGEHQIGCFWNKLCTAHLGDCF